MTSLSVMETCGTEKNPAVFSMEMRLKMTCVVEVPMSMPTLKISLFTRALHPYYIKYIDLLYQKKIKKAIDIVAKLFQNYQMLV